MKLKLGYTHTDLIHGFLNNNEPMCGSKGMMQQEVPFATAKQWTNICSRCFPSGLKGLLRHEAFTHSNNMMDEQYLAYKEYLTTIDETEAKSFNVWKDGAK